MKLQTMSPTNNRAAFETSALWLQGSRQAWKVKPNWEHSCAPVLACLLSVELCRPHSKVRCSGSHDLTQTPSCTASCINMRQQPALSTHSTHTDCGHSQVKRVGECEIRPNVELLQAPACRPMCRQTAARRIPVFPCASSPPIAACIWPCTRCLQSK